jgi:hypothetical protein
MKSFLKLSIAAVLFGAMTLSSSAFAAPVTADSSGKLDVGGIIWVAAGYYQPYEVADANGDLQAPPPSIEVSDEARFNVKWSYETVTAHWEYWMRDDIGRNDKSGGCTDCPGLTFGNQANGDTLLGWINWMPTPAVSIDAGVIQDQSWMERAVDWETHLGTDQVGAPGAYSYMFPEGQSGLDVAYLAGPIKAGLFLSPNGIVSGSNTNYATGTQANTYVVHVEYKMDTLLWISVMYGMESGESAAPIDNGDGVEGYDWGESESFSNTGIGLSGWVDVGVGKVKFQYFMVDGDNWDDTEDPDTGDKVTVDAPTDMALAFIANVGEAQAFVEYDLSTDTGTDDKDKVADQSYVRVGYKMPIDTNSSLQVEYEMADNGASTASKPAVGWVTSF